MRSNRVDETNRRQELIVICDSAVEERQRMREHK